MGHWFVLAALPVFFARRPRYEVIPAVLVILLGLSPWARAVGIARSLPTRLTAAFGQAAPGSPLHWSPPVGAPIHERVGSLDVDHYAPPSPDPSRPVVLFVHGGSWSGGSRSEYPGIFQLLAQAGWDVYSMDYRLAPAHPYPAQLEDIHTVLASLRASGRRVVMMGRSAGAHLALLAAYTNDAAGVIAMYPPVDMVWSWDHPSNPAVLDSRKSLRDFLGGTPTEKPALYAQASPLQIVTARGRGDNLASTPRRPPQGGTLANGSSAAPTLLIHGLHDQLVYPYQSEMLQARLQELGVANLLVKIPWADHGGDVVNAGPMSRLTLYAIESFLLSLGRPGPPA
jgi:acetyl esterase/lipase